MPYSVPSLLREFSGPGGGSPDNTAGPGTAAEAAFGDRIVALGHGAAQNAGTDPTNAVDDVIAIGFDAAEASQGARVIAIGTRAAQNLDNGMNRVIAIGTDALSAAPAGVVQPGHIVIGDQAAMVLSDANDTSYLVIGDRALSNFAGVVEGFGNTVIGNLAAEESASGPGQQWIANTFIGYRAGAELGQAAFCNVQSNTALGYRALEGFNCQQALDNVAIGPGALSAITGGADNVGIGGAAGSTASFVFDAVLGSLTSGDRNTAIGNSAGTSITLGDGNVALGADALPNLTGGEDNVVVGRDAGDGLGLDDENVILGAFAGSASGITDRNVIIGAGAGAALDSTPGDQLIIETRNEAATAIDPTRTLIFGRFTTGSVVFGTANDVNGDPINRGVNEGGTGRNLIKLLNGMAPNADPIGGFYLYVDPSAGVAGELRARGPSGTITTLAAA